MMCYPPSGYIILSLRKLKLYGGRGIEIRVGDQGPDNPNTLLATKICINCHTWVFHLILSQIIRIYGFKHTSVIIILSKVVCWSNSAIVLAWTGNFNKIYEPLVQRRVDNIRSKEIVTQWQGIATLQNPADILSMGASLSVLEKWSCGVVVPAFFLVIFQNKEELVLCEYINCCSKQN